MNHKPFIKRVGACFASVGVALFSVFAFSRCPVSASAETSDLWDSELNAWIDVSMGVLEANMGTIPNAPAWWASLQYMKYALNENDQMIHAGDSWANLTPGFGWYYDDNNHLCGCMFPTNYDTSAHYDSLLICQGSDFSLTVSCSTTAPDFASYVQYNGYYSSSFSNEFTCISTGAYTGARYDFTVTCEGTYFTSLPWTITMNQYALSYPVRFIVSDNYIPTILPTYSPNTSSSRMLINVCGNYSQIDFTGLSIGDIALTQLYEPATLHDYLENTWIPAFETDTGLSLSPVPDDPTQDPTETTEDSGTGCDCHCEVNVEVNVDPTLELPSDWVEDLVDLETQHYTAPYDDLVKNPWDDLQSIYAPTETTPTRQRAQRADGEDEETEDYKFVDFLIGEPIVQVMHDYELMAEKLFDDTDLFTTIAGVLSVGFIIRFVSLK